MSIVGGSTSQNAITTFPERPSHLVDQIHINDAPGIQFIQAANLNLSYFRRPLEFSIARWHILFTFSHK
jgi:hypothetical protein